MQLHRSILVLFLHSILFSLPSIICALDLLWQWNSLKLISDSWGRSENFTVRHCNANNCIYDFLKLINFQTAPGCTQHEFTCGDGSCIPLYRKCDGNRDCRDNSDESLQECYQRAFVYFQWDFSFSNLNLFLQLDAVLVNGNVRMETVSTCQLIAMAASIAAIIQMNDSAVSFIRTKQSYS